MLVGVAVVLAVGFGAVGRGPAVQAQATSQVVFVSVLEGASPVVGLTAEDFVVEEDGEPREILGAQRSTVPMQLAILVDDSYGLTNSLSHIRSGLNEVIDALPDGQQVALISFGDQLRTVVDYTTDMARLKTAAAEFVLFSETSWYLTHALVETATDLWERGAIRPVIILATSEGANTATSRLRAGRQGDAIVSPQGGQGLAADRVLDVLRETRVAVHTLVVRDTGVPAFTTGPASDAGTRGAILDAFGDRERASLLQQLPKVTGGRRDELGNTSALAELFAQVVHELSNQYVVAYARPAGLIPPDEIRVSVTSSGMTVRSTPAPPLR